MPEDFVQPHAAFLVEAVGNTQFLLAIRLANGKRIELARGFTSRQEAVDAANVVKAAGIIDDAN